jgi:hypothetical protein
MLFACYCATARVSGHDDTELLRLLDVPQPVIALQLASPLPTSTVTVSTLPHGSSHLGMVNGPLFQYVGIAARQGARPACWFAAMTVARSRSPSISRCRVPTIITQRPVRQPCPWCLRHPHVVEVLQRLVDVERGETYHALWSHDGLRVPATAECGPHVVARRPRAHCLADTRAASLRGGPQHHPWGCLPKNVLVQRGKDGGAIARITNFS